MPRKKASMYGITLAGLVALLLAATPAVGGKPGGGKELDLELCAPRENTFSLRIDNDFFPLPVGRQWVLQGEDEGQTIGVRITVFDETETFEFRRKTVRTRVVEELEWVDEDRNGRFDEALTSLIEISRNFYAQTQDGTVCYFGEEVDIYEDGEVVSHEGAWRADERRNHAPGIFMPADPQVGMSYQQEVAPGIAEDRATIVGRGSYRVPAGRFRDTITVEDSNPLDASQGTKVYARNVGLIFDDPLELIRVSGGSTDEDD